MKRKNIIEETFGLLKSFCFLSVVFIHAHTCPLRSQERLNKGGREEGRMKEGEKKRGKTCCSSKRPNQLLLLFSLFSEDAIGGRRGFAEWGKAGFDVIPFCNIKPVGFPEASDLDFRDLLIR